MAPSSPFVRDFQQIDSKHLIGLYDRSLAENVHFIRKEHFLKYFMQFPGVNGDSVFVAEMNGDITGLAIVSVTTEIGGLRQGSIIELLARDLLSMRALIRAAVDFCNLKDVDLIVAVPPPLPGADVIFEDWSKFETNVMMTTILSLSSLLQPLLSSEKIRTVYARKKVVFQVGRETVEARIGSRTIEIGKIKGELRHADILVSASPQSFLRIIFGQLNPYVAYLSRRIRIRGVKNALPMLKLLRMMQLTKPFYTSLADRL